MSQNTALSVSVRVPGELSGPSPGVRVREAQCAWRAGPATAVHLLKLFYNIAGAFKIIPFLQNIPS